MNKVKKEKSPFPTPVLEKKNACTRQSHTDLEPTFNEIETEKNTALYENISK